MKKLRKTKNTWRKFIADKKTQHRLNNKNKHLKKRWRKKNKKLKN